MLEVTFLYPDSLFMRLLVFPRDFCLASLSAWTSLRSLVLMMALYPMLANILVTSWISSLYMIISWMNIMSYCMGSAEMALAMLKMFLPKLKDTQLSGIMIAWVFVVRYASMKRIANSGLLIKVGSIDLFTMFRMLFMDITRLILVDCLPIKLRKIKYRR